MLPLSLRAVTIPYSHLSFQLTAAYATLLTFFWVLASISHKIAYGSAREVDISEELVVITGGTSGLGQIIADFYRMKGTPVAVLDIKVPEDEEENGVQYYKCDVGNASEVQAVYKTLTDEVCDFCGLIASC